MNRGQNTYERPKAIFRKHGGVLRTSEAINAGIHPRMLYAMRDASVVEKLSRGLYRLADMPPLGNPDLVSVALKVPKGVICLLSALSYHGITTQIPHEVYIAVPRDSRPPRVDYPPVRVFRFGGETFSSGIECERVDGIFLHIYNPEKTIADCFKYRNKIGLDTAIEALRLYRERKRLKVDNLMRFASICRVEKVIRPYLEALV